MYSKWRSLAVIAVTGSVVTRTVSKSDEFKSFWLSMCKVMLRNLQQILSLLDSLRMAMAYTELQDCSFSVTLVSGLKVPCPDLLLDGPLHHNVQPLIVKHRHTLMKFKLENF